MQSPASPVTTPTPAATSDTELPVAGYDDLSDRGVVAMLHKHSQVELTAIEAFERSHKARSRVFDKLRYLRGSEPVPDYDALSQDAIATAVKGADVATLRHMRVYERKLQGRPDVLDGVADALRDLRPANPERASHRT